MKFHKEGYPTLWLALIFSLVINLCSAFFFPELKIVQWITMGIAGILIITVLQFFRSPVRHVSINDAVVLAPADGKIVAIEEVEESEYFKNKRIQVSIFMSPVNVHVNRYPIGGKVSYVKYHPGLYLVAWHPKSSTENERTTLVVEHPNGKAVLFRQIAGALARRIVYYCKEGDTAVQGEEFGFIKFGSRVDVFLPPDTKIKVTLNQKSIGGITVLAEL